MRNRLIGATFGRVRRGSAGDANGAGSDTDLRHTSPADRQIIERALPYTMTGVARLQAVVDAVRYCVDRGVDGAFAECGVWRGGSVLAMVLTLQDMGASEREIYLYDTFEGMTAPTEHDVSAIDPPALHTWQKAERKRVRPWSGAFGPDVFNEGAVRDLLASTGYAEDNLQFVRGKVEDTLPDRAPEEISLLRLDTDWYESTRHELTYMYPRLSAGGVLIIDDYGHWEGCRRAVDEYFAEQAEPLLLNRIDYTGRIAVKH
jgi:O-methyltransferase